MIVVFDLDGTLVDMRGVHVHTLFNVLDRYGVPVRGIESEEVSRRSLNFVLMKLLPAEQWSSITEIKSKYIHELSKNAGKIKAVEGAREVLESIPERKAIFTVFSRPVTELILKNLKLMEYFDMIVTSDDVSRPKPDPEGLLLISEKLGEEKLVVVGDSRMDVLAAKNFGAISVLVGKRESVDADYFIEKLTDLPEVIENIRLMNRSVFKL